MKKYLTNPIVILIITLVISWSTWITNSAYSNKNLINEYNQHIMTCEKNNKDIMCSIENLKKIIDENNKYFNDKIDNNQKNIYEILINIQRRIDK